MGRYRNSAPPPWSVERMEFSKFLDRHDRWGDFSNWTHGANESSRCRTCDVEWPCQELLDYAAQWSDDPEYREAWRTGESMRWHPW